MAQLAAMWGAVRYQAGRGAICGIVGSMRPCACSASEKVLLHGVHDLPATPQGIIELREYQLQPASLKPYLQLLEQHIERRKQLSPLLGMFTCDTGGSLTSVLHMYHYRDLSHREEARAAAAQDASWQRDIDAGRRAGIVYQASSIIRPAKCSKFADGFPSESAAAFQPGKRTSGSGSGGSGSEGSSDSGGGSGAQRGAYVLALHQPESWGPRGVDLSARLAALGQNAKKLGVHFGAQLAFAGWTVLGTQQILELHRFRSTAELDACVMKIGSLSLLYPYQPVSTLRLLVPLPFSPWQ